MRRTTLWKVCRAANAYNHDAVTRACRTYTVTYYYWSPYIGYFWDKGESVELICFYVPFNMASEGGAESCVVVRPRSLDERLSKFPAQLLDCLCVDDHLVKLTECFSEWQIISTSLELSKVEIQDIESNWPRNAVRQRLEMFRKWQEKMRSKATLRYRCVVCVCVCDVCSWAFFLSLYRTKV